MRKIMLLLIVFLYGNAFSQEKSILQSGPMLGYCEMKEAVIWLQTTQNATVRIEYFDVDNPNNVFISENFTTSEEVGFTYHIVLKQISPSTKYKYQVFIDNKQIIFPFETSFSSKKLWQWREDAPDFSVALGSCSYISEKELDRPGKPYGSGYKIFESINAKNPNIMIWGGDNIYLREADWDSKTGIYHRYTHSRSLKELQPLLAKTQNFAIWDDHDFGPNDSDRSFYFKNLTQKAFKDFWGNKIYGTDLDQTCGIYSTFNWGDAQFFLLDNRFFKSPNTRKTGEKTMLGSQQLEWLIDALSSSNAGFKIIVIGGQVLNSEAIFENYETYPDEKNKLLKEISDNKIKGVMFVSGDRHFAELSVLKRPNDYTLYDWTVSPLTSGVVSEDKVLQEKNSNREENSNFSVNNFGTLSFSGDKNNRQIKLALFDANGIELWQKVIFKKDLQ